MTRTINLSNTQFRYQLVFFVYMYDYIWLAEGCLWHLLPRQNLQWHLLPRQNLPSASFAQAKHGWWCVLPGCMICLIQRLELNYTKATISHLNLSNLTFISDTLMIRKSNSNCCCFHLLLSYFSFQNTAPIYVLIYL